MVAFNIEVMNVNLVLIHIGVGPGQETKVLEYHVRCVS
jgi:hypothetical protein